MFRRLISAIEPPIILSGIMETCRCGGRLEAGSSERPDSRLLYGICAACQRVYYFELQLRDRRRGQAN